MEHTCEAFEVAKKSQHKVETKSHTLYDPDPIEISETEGEWYIDVSLEFAVSGIKFCPFCGQALPTTRQPVE